MGFVFVLLLVVGMTKAGCDKVVIRLAVTQAVE